MEEYITFFDEFMLEWAVFDNGGCLKFNTLIKNTLKEFIIFIEENNINMDDTDYRIRGRRNGKWETLVLKIK
jgi:hypothetical protein